MFFRAVACRGLQWFAVVCRAKPCFALVCRGLPCRVLSWLAVACRGLPCWTYFTSYEMLFEAGVDLVQAIYHSIHEGEKSSCWLLAKF
jgi:hypothetical protein